MSREDPSFLICLSSLSLECPRDTSQKLSEYMRVELRNRCELKPPKMSSPKIVYREEGEGQEAEEHQHLKGGPS